MNGRRLSLWRRIVAIAPALLLVVCLPGQTMLRCRLDGTLRTACCCPGPAGEMAAAGEDGGQAVAAVPPLTSVTSQGCCERTVLEGHRPTAEAARAHEAADAPQQVTVWGPAVAVASAAPTRALRDGAGQRHGPPREGPRLILLKRSFLI